MKFIMLLHLLCLIQATKTVLADDGTTTTTIVTTTTTSSGEEDCYPDAVELDFFDAEVTVNNLGGQGPDFNEAELIRYSNIGTYDGEEFDMVVEVVPGSTYVLANNENNGLNGNFGQINLLLGENVDLMFSFKHATTNELVTLPYFYFSFFDLDQGSKTREEFCIDDTQFHSVHTIDNNDEMDVTTAVTSCSGDASTGSTILSSNPNSRGFGCDNPSDPNALGIVTCEDCPESCTVGGTNSEYFPIDQRNRSASFTFLDTSSFTFSFEIEDITGNTYGRNLQFSGRSSLSPCPSPTPSPTQAPTPGPNTCFSSDDTLQLESGKKVPFVNLNIGDRILSANRDGVVSYSEVLFLPHGHNLVPTSFLEIITDSSKKIKMTRGHLIQLCTGDLVSAYKLSTDKKSEGIKNDLNCIRSVDGEESVKSIKQVKSNGVYTAVTENEFLVVNDIIASPFASSSGLVHAYFNTTDIEDWCSSNNWLVYEKKNKKSPSHCKGMLTNMFEKFKDEPIGWGADGFGYRGWANPASLHQNKIHNKKIKETKKKPKNDHNKNNKQTKEKQKDDVKLPKDKSPSQEDLLKIYLGAEKDEEAQEALKKMMVFGN